MDRKGGRWLCWASTFRRTEPRVGDISLRCVPICAPFVACVFCVRPVYISRSAVGPSDILSLLPAAEPDTLVRVSTTPRWFTSINTADSDTSQLREEELTVPAPKTPNEPPPLPDPRTQETREGCYGHPLMQYKFPFPRFHLATAHY